jgi:hypothetical protein
MTAEDFQGLELYISIKKRLVEEYVIFYILHNPLI